MGPKKKSEKSLQMEDADDNSGFHGTKKNTEKSLPVGAFEL